MVKRSVGKGAVGTSAKDAKQGGKKEPEPEIKGKADFLEKTYGIKFKSATVENKDKGGATLKVTLEFTKNLTDNLDEMRKLLSPFSPGVSKGAVPLWVYYFDSDNVSLGKSSVKLLKGETQRQGGGCVQVVRRDSTNLRPQDQESGTTSGREEVTPNQAAFPLPGEPRPWKRTTPRQR
jgi:hypothetical protein